MAVENKRIQQRYGTYSQFQTDKSNLLPNEFASVTADDPNTLSGKGLYFHSESGEPNRILTDEDKVELDSNITQAMQDASTAKTTAQNLENYVLSNFYTSYIINDMLSFNQGEIKSPRFAGYPHYFWVKLGFQTIDEQRVGGVCLMVIDSPVCTSNNYTLTVPLPFNPEADMKIPFTVGNRTVLCDINAGINTLDIPNIMTGEKVSGVFAYRISIGVG